MRLQRAALAGISASVLLAGIAAIVPAAQAADVTAQRIINADKEPQNWLTNNRDYNSDRYSPLKTINTSNVKNLKLLYSVALNNASPNYTEGTPLAEDGYLYLTDTWGMVYKIDARSGTVGRIVWTMDPGQEAPSQANRGVALAGNIVVSIANGPPRLIGTNKDTGEELWEQNISAGEPHLEITGAPLFVNNEILVGAAGGDAGARDWLAAFDAKTGKQLWKQYNVPAPGEKGSQTWADKINAWQTGGGAMYVTGSYDPKTNITYWGVGNPVPPYDPLVRPGDNLYTDSIMARNPDTGALAWTFQYTPNDGWDYDESGTHILFDGKLGGKEQTLLTHSGRNGFLYTFAAQDGKFLKAEPYMNGINWTKGINPQTGKPLEYDPSKSEGHQTYAAAAARSAGDLTKPACPANVGGNNFWPSTLSGKTHMLYIPAITGCVTVTTNPAQHTAALGFGGGGYVVDQRLESDLVQADPVTGKIINRTHLKYPNYAGALSTGGGLVFTALEDGSVLAFDDKTLKQVWQFNTGVGFTAPPMTFSVGGKQYIAITSGLSGSARGKLKMTPELSEQRNAAMLYVFGL
jgi:alcohol dehydrogenase (cytochrome c)